MIHFDYTVNWGTFFDLIMVWIGRKLIKIATEARQSLGVVFWEHKVMWDDWKRKNKVPKFPNVRHEAHHPFLRTDEEKA